MDNQPTEKSENVKVAKAAGIVGAATMVSRVFGVIRDMVIAALFGASWMTDAFWVAFRIPNMLRRLLGEGSLTVSFVPVFTEYLQKKTKEEALELAQNAFTLLSILLAVVSVIGILLSPLIVGLIAPGFIAKPEQIRAGCFFKPPDVSVHLFYRPGGLMHGHFEFLQAFYDTGPVAGHVEYRDDRGRARVAQQLCRTHHGAGRGRPHRRRIAVGHAVAGAR